MLGQSGWGILMRRMQKEFVELSWLESKDRRDREAASIAGDTPDEAAWMYRWDDRTSDVVVG